MQNFQLNLARALAVMFLATAACAADSLPPLFRQVHDCNVDLNPVLSYDGLSTLSTIKIRGQEHLANAVPAVRGKGTVRKVGFYLLTDADRATFVETGPLTSKGVGRSGPLDPSVEIQAPGVTEDLLYTFTDSIHGSFEARLHMACTARFPFNKEDGAPTMPVRVESGGEAVTIAGGYPVSGTCSNAPGPQGVIVTPPSKSLRREQIDSAVTGPEVDHAAFEDLKVRLSAAMGKIAGKVNSHATDPALRRNACHLLHAFFEGYNECGSKALTGAGGRPSLASMSMSDPVFGARFQSLKTLYDSYLDKSDTPECRTSAAPTSASSKSTSAGSANE